MNTTKSERRVSLKFIGHLAEDHEGGETSLMLSKSPSVISICGIETPCMAYFNGRQGLVCYINDGDANSIARNQFTSKAIAV